MKKIIAALAAVMILFASVSLAEDLTSLGDEELINLFLQVRLEMEHRGISPALAADSAVSGEKAAASERLREFFVYWSRNDLDGMMTLCAPSWQEREEQPRTALFALLRNRTPLDMTVESFIGDPADGSVHAAVVSRMDRHNGKDPVVYRLELEMVREDDGLWYLNPRSLVTEESGIVYADTTPEPAQVPEGLTDGTLLYYQPEGGSYYHLDPNCRRVNERFLPLEDCFTWAEVNDEAYRSLKPCEICGAPER